MVRYTALILMAVVASSTFGCNKSSDTGAPVPLRRPGGEIVDGNVVVVPTNGPIGFETAQQLCHEHSVLSVELERFGTPDITWKEDRIYAFETKLNRFAENERLLRMAQNNRDLNVQVHYNDEYIAAQRDQLKRVKGHVIRGHRVAAQ